MTIRSKKVLPMFSRSRLCAKLEAAASRHFAARSITGVTLASASSIEKATRESIKTGASIDAAKTVGKLIAARAKEKGVTDVVFDRGAYLYHGRVKALADAAREGGLKF